MTEIEFVQILKKYGREALFMVQDELSGDGTNAKYSYRFLLDTEIMRKLHIYSIPLPRWVDDTTNAGYINLVEIDWDENDKIVGFEIKDPNILTEIINKCLTLKNTFEQEPIEQQKVLDSVLSKF